MSEPRICEKGGQGVVFPKGDLSGTIHDPEEGLPLGLAASLYLLFLLWCFLGVALVADTFMAAIEAVTSKRMLKLQPDGEWASVKLWNPTVANLSLMALGSSAPEILLSVIEVIGADFFAASLGPSTIVGSAAFNLLFIIAICIISIPAGESRTMKQLNVFIVTGFFSVFAYLWLVIILLGPSPEVVDVPEGICTFLFFPVLLIVAYLADIGMFNLGSEKLKDDEEECIVDGASRAAQRLKVTAQRIGKRDSFIESNICVGFMSSIFSFDDYHKNVRLDLEKFGDHANLAEVLVTYNVENARKTVVGNGTLSINAGTTREVVEVDVPCRSGSTTSNVSGMVPEESMMSNRFSVVLTSAVIVNSGQDLFPSGVTIPEKLSKATIRMRPSTSPAREGLLRFAESTITHTPNSQAKTAVSVSVRRVGSCHGTLSCKYYTKADTAREHLDFMPKSGEISFSDGAANCAIHIEICAKAAYEDTDKFHICLEDLGDDVKAIMSTKSVCTVIITESSKNRGIKDDVLRVFDKSMNIDALVEGTSAWKQQFISAFHPATDDNDATPADWAVHVLAMPWKLLFAFIPPTPYCGGWVCFFVALLFIGGVTAIIGDVASLVGCCMGIPDGVTAITIVALGTSIPDAFASRIAAVEEPTADAAIGNITGSNSVNVFLGLGLPWMAAAIYWEANTDAGVTDNFLKTFKNQKIGDELITEKYETGAFVVKSDGLVFSVGVFTVLSCVALGLIVYRRIKWRSELGGPLLPKVATAVFFVGMWVMYVCLASWSIIRSENGATPSIGTQIGAVLAGFFVLFASMAVLAIGWGFCIRFCGPQADAEKPKPRRASTELEPMFNQQSTVDLGPNLVRMEQEMAEIKSNIAGLQSTCQGIQVMFKSICQNLEPTIGVDDETDETAHVSKDKKKKSKKMATSSTKSNP